MKKAVVTGHSQGLGEALAGKLFSGGYDVLGISRSGLSIEPAGCIAMPDQVSLDLSEIGLLDSWIESRYLAEFLHGATETLSFNNAGIMGPMSKGE